MIYILYALLGIVGILLLLLLVAVIKTLFVKLPETSARLAVDEKRSIEYAEKLGVLIKKETISDRDNDDKTKFYEFHKLLEEAYPLVHKTCEKTVFNGSLLFKWKGKSDKDPIMLMSHHDIVEATGKWDYPALSGEIIEQDGRKVIWGRGTVDTKGSLSCFMQAVEELIASGYQSECDVYLTSTCTEEIGGEGAPLINNYLKEKGVKLKMLVDEGGMMVEAPMAGARGVFAMVGVLEKGYGDLKFTAKSNGGHASAPPKNTPIARLSKFVCDVESNYPFCSKFPDAVKEMFARLAPTMPFAYKLIFSNLWLFTPLLKKLMPAISSQGAAMLRTTIAFTMQQGSSGYNVIPQEAFVTANLRFIPHQSTDESIAIMEKRAKKYDIDTGCLYRGYPAPVVDFNAGPFKLLEDQIHKNFPDVYVTPYVMTGGTDARFLADVCDHCLRFSPLRINKQQLGSVHGLNENIDIDTLPQAVDFYKSVIKAQ